MSTELDNASASINTLNSNLSLIQGNDGRLLSGDWRWRIFWESNSHQVVAEFHDTAGNDDRLERNAAKIANHHSDDQQRKSQHGQFDHYPQIFVFPDKAHGDQQYSRYQKAKGRAAQVALYQAGSDTPQEKAANGRIWRLTKAQALVKLAFNITFLDCPDEMEYRL